MAGKLAQRLTVDTAKASFVFEHTERGVLARLGDRPGADIVLLDWRLAGLSGSKGVRTVRPLLRRRRLGVLAQKPTFEEARRALVAGAQGVLPLDASRDLILSGIALLTANQRFILFDTPVVLDTNEGAETLSERELQVLRGICDGLQNKEIAHSFQVQEVTVKMHVRAIIRKLSARNRTHAAMIARDLGIV
ncbi:DNA-binding response regulator [Sinisalibacter aestuarii]|uniref:DNA-binding response regulator n=1 Tax=Sinisalibacter aestuarii TaxID=2949426 RepID=A0ABQ5LP35_9RHOB|nr:DNA-binding response regulator [Sinisalibacter aestuarii]